MLGSPHARERRRRPGPTHLLASKRYRFCVGYRWTDASSPADALCLFAMNRNTHDPSKLHDCTEQSRVGLYKGHTFSHLTYIEIFIHSFFHTFERETEFCTQFGFDSQHRKCFLLLGDHFILGDKLPLYSKHHCEGNTCLKEIVSNTKLDLQTGSFMVFLQTY